MDITFWGTRGSAPCHTAVTQRYGGATSCFTVTTAEGHVFILDAGSGICSLGDELVQRPDGGSCTILLSHSHWDHLCGLPMFQPLYDPKWKVTICTSALFGGVGTDLITAESSCTASNKTGPESILRRLFDPVFFPVSWDALPYSPTLRTLEMGASYTLHKARIRCAPAAHGAGGTAFLLEADQRTLFFSGDHELGEEPDLDTPFYQLLRGADMAVVDAHFSAAEYANKKNWGHSAMEHWPPLIEKLDIGQLILTHFDTSHTDLWLDSMDNFLKFSFPAVAERICLAHTNLTLHVGEKLSTCIALQEPCPCCDATEKLSHLTDTSQIFDALLQKMRTLSGADAGTLYLLEDERLVFAYSQNETLFTASQAIRQQYLTASLPVDATSIAGFVALHKVTLNIEDVRRLAANVPYSFNERFDNATGYRTVSMCVMPLCSQDNTLLGVVQLINCTENGRIVPFTRYRQSLAERLCVIGTQAIERGMQVRNMILRMLQTAALRDPTETAGHVMRVGAMVAELYHCWAERRGIDIGIISQQKAQLRLAAMLHDVGKVGIADMILKKRGRLTPEERVEIEQHCALGARLFADAQFEMDLLARDIALHHHQKWDGSGYTGDPNIPVLAGENIPIGARMTAIADVFDALISPRIYKEPWPLDRVLDALNKDKGYHFDPELVDAFLEIHDTMLAICAKYPG